jgi:hypothetical protein
MNMKLDRSNQQLLAEDPWGLQDMLEDVKLLHLHPTSGFGEEGTRPPEYVVYQVSETRSIYSNYIASCAYW